MNKSLFKQSHQILPKEKMNLLKTHIFHLQFWTVIQQLKNRVQKKNPKLIFLILESQSISTKENIQTGKESQK